LAKFLVSQNYILKNKQMKKIATIILILFFANSFAQTTTTKKPVAKPTTTKKPTTTVKTGSKSTATTKPKPTSSTKPAAAKPATQQARPVEPVQQPKPAPVQPAPQPTPKPVTPQPAPQVQSNQAPTHVSTSKIESIWIGGSVGGGLALSTNIVNSGAVFPANLELLFQTRHHRCGIGFANELYITPESLTRLAFGEAPVVKKLYFGYELFLFRNFPINLGFSSHIGFFGTGGSNSKAAQMKTTSDTASGRGGLFGNIGAVLEIGARPFYFFVRPSIEYKSWSGWHKEIIATGSVGIRLKFLTDYEIQRRAEKKRDRDHKY
jgi:hypothetical protein